MTPKNQITETLYGYHSVAEAIKAKRRKIHHLYIARDSASSRIKTIVHLGENNNIPIKQIRTSDLKTLTGTASHQGIGAKVSPFPLMNWSEVQKKTVPEGSPGFFILLDNILDPHNLGAIIRTGLCVGADGIILPKDRSAPPSPTVSKISSGALEHCHLTRVTNMVTSINALKKRGMWVAGLDASGSQSLFSTDLKGPMAIVIGSEEKGIRPLVKKQCDFLLSIPQEGVIDSLNASIAAAVVLYEIYRQRTLSEKSG